MAATQRGQPGQLFGPLLRGTRGAGGRRCFLLPIDARNNDFSKTTITAEAATFVHPMNRVNTLQRTLAEVTKRSSGRLSFASVAAMLDEDLLNVLAVYRAKTTWTTGADARCAEARNPVGSGVARFTRLPIH